MPLPSVVLLADDLLIAVQRAAMFPFGYAKKVRHLWYLIMVIPRQNPPPCPKLEEHETSSPCRLLLMLWVLHFLLKLPSTPPRSYNFPTLQHPGVLGTNLFFEPQFPNTELRSTWFEG